MSNITDVLIPWFEPTKPWSNVADYRYCADGMCASCPFENSFYGSEHVLVMTVLFYFAMLAVIVNGFVLLVYAILPRKKTNCNIYTSGIAVANICFAAGFLFVRTPENRAKTLCYDSITRATGLRVSRCAVSGLLLVYGYLSTRFWLLLWVTDMHFSIVHNKRFDGMKRNWSVALVVITPVALALASLPFLSYVLGPFCLPSAGYPLYVIMEAPVAFIDGGTIILQIWTLVCVIRALMQSRAAAGSIPSSAQSSLSTMTQLKNIPLVKACLLLCRPILYTQLIHVSNIVLGVSFVYNWAPINSHGKISERWQQHLTVWLACLGTNPGETCIVTEALALGRLRSAGLLATVFVAIIFAILSIRLENLQDIGSLLRDSCRYPRNIFKRETHPSDLFETKASFFSTPVGLTDPETAGSKPEAEVQVTQKYVTPSLAHETSTVNAKSTTFAIAAQEDICSSSQVTRVRSSEVETQIIAHNRMTGACGAYVSDEKNNQEIVEQSLTNDNDNITTMEMLPWSRQKNTTGRGSFDSDVRPLDDLTPIAAFEEEEKKDYIN